MYFKSIFIAIVCAIFFNPSFAQDRLVNPIRAYNYKTLPAPAGMVYIPGGSIVVKYGQADSENNTIKKFSVSSFYIDKTEVTNKQYRDFLNWVIDSVAIVAYIKDDRYFDHNGIDSNARAIRWRGFKHHGRGLMSSKNGDIQSKISPMFDHGQIRQKLYTYAYTYLKRGKPGDPKDHFVTEIVNVYPDTKVWATDFPNSQTDELVAEYFTNSAYDDYPVVGVTWKQARAFAAWRSTHVHARKSRYIKGFNLPCTLPSEAQWAYAAQGKQAASEDYSSDSASAPRDKKNRLMANFKQDEGNYTQDGASYTVPVTSYAPNAFGLYNMEGNVAEWVLDAYNESAWAFVHDQNPVLLYDADSSESNFMKNKVVRGGSWKDNASYLSPYIRDYESQDVPHSYIGFRCVMPAPEILGKEVETHKAGYASRRNRKEAPKEVITNNAYLQQGTGNTNTGNKTNIEETNTK
jgi:sulfatase modifying factor 1